MSYPPVLHPEIINPPTPRGLGRTALAFAAPPVLEVLYLSVFEIGDGFGIFAIIAVLLGLVAIAAIGKPIWARVLTAVLYLAFQIAAFGILFCVVAPPGP